MGGSNCQCGIRMVTSKVALSGAFANVEYAIFFGGHIWTLEMDEDRKMEMGDRGWNFDGVTSMGVSVAGVFYTGSA